MAKTKLRPPDKQDYILLFEYIFAIVTNRKPFPAISKEVYAAQIQSTAKAMDRDKI